MNPTNNLLNPKQYELSINLGYVQTNACGKKLPKYNGSGVFKNYEAEVVCNSAIQKTAFGMVMPNRAYNKAGYRFGYNGKEMDNEVSGQGNQYDYGFRIYNPRLGKFLSVDPLTKSYPELTTYQFASNTPIQAIDLDGLEACKVVSRNKDGSTTITVSVDIKIIDQSKKTSTSTFSLQNFEKNVQNEVSSNYNSYDKELNTHYVFNINFKEVSKEQINTNSDYYMVVVDAVTDKEGNVDEYAVGKVNTIGNPLVNKIQVATNDDKGMSNTAAHEVGHTLGLNHDDNDRNNLMRSVGVLHTDGSRDETHLNDSQRKQATDNVIEKGTKPVQGAQKQGQYVNSPEVN